MSACSKKSIGILPPWPSLATCMALLLALCFAASCLAQEDGEAAEAGDRLQNALKLLQQKQANAESKEGADRTSPQQKAAQASEAAKRRNQELLHERQQQEVGEQHALAEDEYRKALSNLESLLQQPNAQLYQQRAVLEQQLRDLEAKRNALAQQMAQMLAAESATRRQQQQNTLMPKDGSFKVFSLRHSRATDAARVLREVLGGAATRLAVDERTNSLLVFADDETIKIVEALMMKLDERSEVAAIDQAQPGETLQLRIVWLLDIDEGIDPNHKLVSPEVVEALHELGFENPKVVCQQVTTLTLGDEDRRRGQFHFAVPVLIKAQPWQFEGQGQIESMAGERFNVKFDLRFQQRSVTDGEPMGQEGQLGGSIYTPLGHYTVMGTTTFVSVIPEEDSPKQQQNLSAFVVYLDRAREYPATEAPSNNRTDVRR
jgi:hypothetical protein